ncbi:MAG TPA: sulfur relay protein DsrC [Chryseobacterium sp.]|nr:sulfur relay protein DsrC [Chryseobacterium sp.]
MEKTIAGKVINVNEEGYLLNMDEWNEDIAKELAQEENIELSPRHFEVLNYLRDQQRKEVALTIRGVGKSGVVDIKEFYVLFPKGPLKISSKVAGIPKPKSCI